MTIEQNQRCAINYLNELKASTSGYAVNWLDIAIKALEQQPCEDCISREDILEFLKGFEILHNHDELRSNLIYGIMNMPPVTPQPKMGRWEYVQYDNNPNIGNWHCSECRGICTEMHSIEDAYNYCPNCGAKMEAEE